MALVLDREVGDQDDQRADDRQPEEGGDLRSARLAAFGVDVGHPVPVRRQAGVLEPLGQRPARPGVATSAPGAAVVASSLIDLVPVAHDDLAPSHTAQPISSASPTTHATRPSLTGPMAPRVKPPGVGCLVDVIEVGDDVPLALRVDGVCR